MKLFPFKIRFRYVFMAFFTIVGLGLLILLDPDLGIIQELSWGAGFLASLSAIFKFSLYVALLHLARRSLFDYFQMGTVFRKAMETSEGAGKIWLGVCLVMVALAIVMLAAISS